MIRFLSNYTNRFDAKGRISIPAPFRALLAQDGCEGVHVYPSLDAPALDCGGAALLKAIDAMLEAMPAYSEQRDLFATALLGTSEILRADSEGRIQLSERSRSFLGLSGEAVFVGLGYKFQIWQPARFAAHLEEAKSRVRRLRTWPGSEAANAVQQGARE